MQESTVTRATTNRWTWPENSSRLDDWLVLDQYFFSSLFDEAF